MKKYERIWPLEISENQQLFFNILFMWFGVHIFGSFVGDQEFSNLMAWMMYLEDRKGWLNEFHFINEAALSN